MTSTSGRGVADELRTPSGLVVPADAMAWRFSRSSGAGGQHVNTTASKAELVIDLTQLDGPAPLVARVRARHGDVLAVTGQRFRSQWRNRQDCVERAIDLLDEATVREADRVATRPTRAQRARRLDAKHRAAAKKRDRRWRPGDD